MTKVELETKWNTHAQYDRDLSIDKYEYVPMIAWMPEPMLGVGFVNSVSNANSGGKHNVVIFYNGTEYYYWCGDKFLEKLRSPLEIKMAFEALNISPQIQNAVKQTEGKFVKSTACSFWRNGRMCKHTKFTFDQHSFVDITNYLKIRYDDLMDDIESTTPVTTSFIDKMKMYAFKKHIILTGDRGWGKTYSSLQLLKKESIPHVFIQGAPDMDSAFLRGGMKPYENGFIWTDGKLTEAFRRASMGEKVAIVFDEILRCPAEELAILISALTAGPDGNYTLVTDRPIVDKKTGIARTETISANPNYLWLIATTNIGNKYQVEEPDTAFYDRFRFIETPKDYEIAKNILKSSVKKTLQSNVDKAIMLAKATNKMSDDAKLEDCLNLRHLSEVFSWAKNKNELVEMLLDLAPQVCRRQLNGQLDSSQHELFVKAVNKYMK